MSNPHTHLGIAPEEAIWDGDVDVERQRLQDAGLGGDELLSLVCVVANVKEVVDTRRAALLQEYQSKENKGLTVYLTLAVIKVKWPAKQRIIYFNLHNNRLRLLSSWIQPNN